MINGGVYKYLAMPSSNPVSSPFHHVMKGVKRNALPLVRFMYMNCELYISSDSVAEIIHTLTHSSRVEFPTLIKWKLDQSISIFRLVTWYFFFVFINF